MEISRHWRLRQQRYQLVGENCPSCQEKIFPPRDICPGCGGLTVERNESPIEGTILFAAKPDKQRRVTVMAKLDCGKTGFGEISLGEKEGDLLGRRVVWQPEWRKDFASAGNKFGLLAVAEIEINNGTE